MAIVNPVFVNPAKIYDFDTHRLVLTLHIVALMELFVYL